jgi:hypothetical protein
MVCSLDWRFYFFSLIKNVFFDFSYFRATLLLCVPFLSVQSGVFNRFLEAAWTQFFSPVEGALPLTPMTRVSTRVARFLLVRYTNFLLDIV